MKKELRRKEQSTGALLQRIAGRLCCTFLSDLHQESKRELANWILIKEQSRFCILYGEQAYREALNYIRNGGEK